MTTLANLGANEQPDQHRGDLMMVDTLMEMCDLTHSFAEPEA